MTPNSNPVEIDSDIVNRITVGSMRTSAKRGIPSGLRLISQSSPQMAKRRPNAPPSAPRITLSVSSCRTRRNRPPPSALRTAISLSRVAARARRRFATFVHAISSTNPTAPSRTRIARRMSPTMASCSGIAVNSSPSLSFGYWSASRFPIVCTSAVTCSSWTPGFARPITLKYQAPRCVFVKPSVSSSGVQITRPAGYANSSRHHTND